MDTLKRALPKKGEGGTEGPNIHKTIDHVRRQSKDGNEKKDFISGLVLGKTGSVTKEN